MARRVVITGMGAISPLGMGVDALYERWRDGVVGIEEWRGACGEFDPTDVLSRKELRLTSRYVQLAVVAAHEAQEQAGWYDGLPTDPENIACFVGSCYAGLEAIENEAVKLAMKGGRPDALAVPNMLPDAACAGVSIRYGLRGPSQCVATACAAGGDAIASAVRLIRSGEVDAAIAGGSESSMTDLCEKTAVRIGAVSRKGVSRPFDRRRDGFIPGEGAGMLTLEAAEVAEARGADVIAEIIGIGASSDAFHVSAPSPDGRQAGRAISRAMDDAGVKPEEISYINAHGTSTPLNDKSETLAIKLALGEVAHEIPVSSTKSVIGHTLGAAGALEAIATVESLRKRCAPHTVNYEEPDPELDLDYIPDKPRALGNGASTNGSKLTALTNSFGFGGHNCVICIRA
ncbi:MAG: beta-ketoacyl-[acyl-carrier-protein] synthase family protein [Gaiellaceae bacterium]